MLLVSIHDVSPAQAAAVARLWSLCAERGITPALLVVPNWHGERHDEVGLPRGLADRWRAWGRTHGEGEFLTLDATSARERLSRGLDLLRGLGLDPTGFVPPAWLAREVAYQAAAAAGLAFSEDDRSVRLLPLSQRVASPVVRWSGRTRTRAWGSVGVAGVRWLVQRRARFPRIALHPGDLDHPATTRSVAWSLDRWLRRHSPGSYAALGAGVSA